MAETLLNPYGFDDEDFEANWILDRNFQVTFLMADYLAFDHPELSRDVFWGVRCPDLPYTDLTMQYKMDVPFTGSSAYAEPFADMDEVLAEYRWAVATQVCN